MARRASGRDESRSDVIWHGRVGQRQCDGALPLSDVATVAVEWRRSGTGVAKVAGHRDVRAGQRKRRGVVVKNRALP